MKIKALISTSVLSLLLIESQAVGMEDAKQTPEPYNDLYSPLRLSLKNPDKDDDSEPQGLKKSIMILEASGINLQTLDRLQKGDQSLEEEVLNLENTGIVWDALQYVLSYWTKNKPVEVIAVTDTLEASPQVTLTGTAEDKPTVIESILSETTGGEAEKSVTGSSYLPGFSSWFASLWGNAAPTTNPILAATDTDSPSEIRDTESTNDDK